MTLSGRAESATPPVQVCVSLFGFTPSTHSVHAGTIVTWVDDDERPHKVTSADGFFASRAILSGESFSFRFDAPGTYTYFSGFQPHLTGTIVVRQDGASQRIRSCTAGSLRARAAGANRRSTSYTQARP